MSASGLNWVAHYVIRNYPNNSSLGNDSITARSANTVPSVLPQVTRIPAVCNAIYKARGSPPKRPRTEYFSKSWRDNQVASDGWEPSFLGRQRLAKPSTLSSIFDSQSWSQSFACSKLSLKQVMYQKWLGAPEARAIYVAATLTDFSDHPSLLSSRLLKKSEIL